MWSWRQYGAAAARLRQQPLPGGLRAGPIRIRRCVSNRLEGLADGFLLVGRVVLRGRAATAIQIERREVRVVGKSLPSRTRREIELQCIEQEFPRSGRSKPARHRRTAVVQTVTGRIRTTLG